MYLTIDRHVCLHLCGYFVPTSFICLVILWYVMFDSINRLEHLDERVCLMECLSKNGAYMVGQSIA